MMSFPNEPSNWFLSDYMTKHTYLLVKVSKTTLKILSGTLELSHLDILELGWEGGGEAREACTAKLINCRRFLFMFFFYS